MRAQTWLVQVRNRQTGEETPVTVEAPNRDEAKFAGCVHQFKRGWQQTDGLSATPVDLDTDVPA